jgi:hypothetical protein
MLPGWRARAAGASANRLGGDWKIGEGYLPNRRDEAFQDVPAVIILWIQLKKIAIAFDGVGLVLGFQQSLTQGVIDVPIARELLRIEFEISATAAESPRRRIA